MSDGLDVVLTSKQIESNLEKICALMAKAELDGYYISGSDPYLNEYVKRSMNHRYYLSGFTGSTGDLLLLPSGGRLYVDGRYHEQADSETHQALTVVKVEHGNSNRKQLLSDIFELKIKRLGYESDRTSQLTVEQFKELEIELFPSIDEVAQIVGSKSELPTNPIYALDEFESKESYQDKISKIIGDNEALFLSQLDQISWLVNCRGFHLPYQSIFLARMVALKEQALIFVPEGIPIEPKLQNHPFLTFIYVKSGGTLQQLVTLRKNHQIDRIFYSKSSVTAEDYHYLSTVFNERILTPQENMVADVAAKKSETEIVLFKEAFARANQAIFKTIKDVIRRFE
ncbi:MAG: hypothetical protein HN623_13390, partial [Bdellovibrionales bacterium]|nr:hypothetical protein [Bdellovibrionales bacterium]